MKVQSEASRKKAESKLKIMKDYSFLLNYKSIQLSDKCTKYILEEGEGQILSQQPHQFDIIHSCKTYDYDGKTLITYDGGKAGKSDKKDPLMYMMLSSMKVNQRAWFNVSEQSIHRDRSKINMVDEYDDLIDDTEVNDTSDFKELHTTSYCQRRGIHYEIKVIKLEYKNQDTIDGKRLVIEQKNQQAKIHFANKNYSEAIKLYKFIYDITSNCSKKLFNQEQILQLEGLSTKARLNFLKCYFKIIQTNNIESQYEQYNQFAQLAIKDLISKQPNDSVIRFLHAKWLLKQRLLDKSFEEAKRAFSLTNNQSEQATIIKLMELVREQKRNKGKIKMRVDSQK